MSTQESVVQEIFVEWTNKGLLVYRSACPMWGGSLEEGYTKTTGEKNKEFSYTELKKK